MPKNSKQGEGPRKRRTYKEERQRRAPKYGWAGGEKLDEDLQATKPARWVLDTGQHHLAGTTVAYLTTKDMLPSRGGCTKSAPSSRQV